MIDDHLVYFAIQPYYLSGNYFIEIAHSMLRTIQKVG